MAKLFDFSKVLKTSRNGDDGPLDDLIDEVVRSTNQPDPAGGWSRSMRDDETIREYVEAILLNLRQTLDCRICS